MYELAKRRTKEDLRLIIALWWVAWYERNQFVFEKKFLDPQNAAAKAEAVVEAYVRVKTSRVNMTARSVAERKMSWLSPPEGSYKVNVNAAINGESHQADLGVVIRDGNESVLPIVIQQIMFNGDIAQVEATTVNLGIQVAMDTKWTPLIIESDCKEFVDLVSQKKSSRTEICWIIAKIQNKMKGDNMVAIQHIPRECNAAAHALAKIALASNDDCISRGSFPPQIKDVITLLFLMKVALSIKNIKKKKIVAKFQSFNFTLAIEAKNSKSQC